MAQFWGHDDDQEGLGLRRVGGGEDQAATGGTRLKKKKRACRAPFTHPNSLAPALELQEKTRAKRHSIETHQRAVEEGDEEGRVRSVHPHVGQVEERVVKELLPTR